MMRTRTIALLTAAAAALAPTTSFAGNPEDCDSPIEVWSGKGFSFNAPNGINCGTLNDPTLTYSPLAPGGDMIVNFAGVQPIDGSKVFDFGSYLEYDSTSATGAVTSMKVWLKGWHPAESTTGEVDGWQADGVTLSALDSVIAGPVRFVVIEPVPDFFDPEQCDERAITPDNPEGCYTVYERTYQTPAGYAS